MATNKPPEEAPPSPETLKYQTLVFKVLIHCDGCTKRVKKILQGIEGVYTADIDSQQHKVTVTGNVEAETIIKKLSRSGKSVELWPVQKPAEAEKKKDKKSGKSKGEKTEDNIVKNDKENQPIGEDCIDNDNNGGEDCQENNECEGGASGNTGGENSKKKKKKKKKNKGGQNGNSASTPPNNEEGKEISSNNTEKMGTSNLKEITNPPIQHAYPPPQYQIPNMYYSPPQIPHPPPPPPPQAPYGLSYNINTSYPISNPSYYVGAPIMPMHAYTNSYNHLPPPSDLINGRDYDDEYEGGGYCSIM